MTETAKRFSVETSFADVRLAKGLAPMKNVHIKGPSGFRATFVDSPENRTTAAGLVGLQDEIAKLREALAGLLGAP